MRIHPWKVSTFALAAALACVVSFDAVRAADAEPQAGMQAALVHLREAKTQLDRASHDHGGHRAKAVTATKTAIAETELGIAWAAEHGK